MKKYLLILIVAIFCLPSEGFAQFYSTIFGKEAERQRSRSIPFNFSDHRTEKKQKPRIHYSYLLAVENTTDEATGLTTLSWADGSSYVGLTDRGAMFVGTLTYADGSKYIGKWERNLPNGEGTFINPEGVAFTGKFKDGEPHGKCIIQDTDGQLYKARWYYGKLLKHSIKPLEEKNTK